MMVAKYKQATHCKCPLSQFPYLDRSCFSNKIISERHFNQMARKHCCQEEQESMELKGEVSFSSKIVWGSWAPTKVGFFVWETAWGRILTMDQLKRREKFLAGYCHM